MTSYKCDKCNFSTDLRQNYFRHLNTQKHKKRLDDSYSLSCEDGKKDKSALLMTHKRLTNRNFDSQMTHNFPSLTHNFFEKSHHTSHLKCEYCSESFSRRNNLIRHQKLYCKEKVNKESYQENITITLNKQSKQISELVNMIASNSINEGNHTNYSVSNNNNNNINSNNINNTITINNFGNENLDMLTNKFMRAMVDRPYTAIPKMIKKIHFNEKYPENQNIRMLNKRDNKLQIIENGKWTYVDKDDTLDTLVGDNNYTLDNFYEKNKNVFNDRQKKRFNTFQDKIGESDKQVTGGISKDTDLVFWNHM